VKGEEGEGLAMAMVEGLTAMRKVLMAMARMRKLIELKERCR